MSLIFSQPSDEVMQRATHVRDIYDQGHALLYSKSEEEAASGASMLATPMVVVTARMEMYQFLKRSNGRVKEQSTVRVSAMLVVTDVTPCECCTTD